MRDYGGTISNVLSFEESGLREFYLEELECPEFMEDAFNNIKLAFPVEEKEKTFKINRTYLIWKSIVDRVLSLLALIVLSPFFVFLIAIIKVVDSGKAIYKSKRVGKDGKEFYVYKFCSMKEGADSFVHLSEEELREYQVNFKIKNDPRVTKLGDILRKTSLDELPQILNILKGEMSIIGPRPVLFEEVMFYGEYADTLLKMKPGLTGYWQAYARSNVSSYEHGDRQILELTYVSKCSVGFDIKIFFKTIVSILKKEGAI